VTETFLRLPVADPASLDADLAILGVPHGVPYPHLGGAAGCAAAPSAIRRRSLRLARFVGHHDFDLDGPMPPATPLRAVDCGDVPDVAAAEAAVRQIARGGAVPIILGGDDSVPIAVLRGLDRVGPLWVLQIDAHLDFRDEVDGVREGYSSPMRRAAEMDHVERIVQVGLRGVGSARTSDVEDARNAGNLLVTARELRERGVAWLLEQLPTGVSVFISVDLDGLDPSVAPAVSAPSPGGLSYDEASDLVGGAGGRCRLAGMAITEYVPALDVNELTALVAARLVIRALDGGLSAERA
jgi:agmatinase